MNNKRHTFHLHHSYYLGNSKGFRNSVPGMGMNTKYVFLIINHNIIAICIKTIISTCNQYNKLRVYFFHTKSLKSGVYFIFTV